MSHMRCEECLLTLQQELIDAWMRDNVAKHFQAATDELSALLNVWIQHIEMTDVVVIDITGSTTHIPPTKELRNEFLNVMFNTLAQLYLLRLSSWRFCIWDELFDSGGEDATEAAAVVDFVLDPLCLPLGLVRYLEMLSGQQLMRVLRMRVWIVFLVLGNVIAFETHVLLGAGGRTFDAWRPSSLLLRLDSLSLLIKLLRF